MQTNRRIPEKMPYPERLADVDWEKGLRVCQWFMDQRLRHMKISEDESEDIKQTVAMRILWFAGYKGKKITSTMWCNLTRWVAMEKYKYRRQVNPILGHVGSTCSVQCKQFGEHGCRQKTDGRNLAEEIAHADHMKHACRAAMKWVPSRGREVLYRRHVLGQRFIEIGAALGVSRARACEVFRTATLQAQKSADEVLALMNVA